MNMHKKTILITGATRGLGAALAHSFAQAGAEHLILIARTLSGLEALDDALAPHNVKTTLVQLDLNDQPQLLNLGPALSEKFSTIDVVIGNAGILGRLSPLTHYDVPMWHQVFTVNFHANWLLLKTLEPLYMKAPNPRLIFVTSGVAQKHLPYWGPYALSKSALESMVQLYANETSQSALRINIVDPGILRTDLFHEAMPGVDLNTVPHPSSIADVFLTLASDSYQQTGQIVQAKHFSKSSTHSK